MIARLEGEVLEAMIRHDDQAAEIARREEEVQKLIREVAQLQADIDTRAVQQRAQLFGSLELGALLGDRLKQSHMLHAVKRRIRALGRGRRIDV